MRSLAIAIVLVIFPLFIWNVVGLALSPLGPYLPSEEAFQIGSSKPDAHKLALKLTQGACEQGLQEQRKEIETLGFAGNFCPMGADRWWIEYEDVGPIMYPRHSFVELRFTAGRVSEVSGRRIFWIVF